MRRLRASDSIRSQWCAPACMVNVAAASKPDVSPPWRRAPGGRRRCGRPGCPPRSRCRCCGLPPPCPHTSCPGPCPPGRAAAPAGRARELVGWRQQRRRRGRWSGACLRAACVCICRAASHLLCSTQLERRGWAAAGWPSGSCQTDRLAAQAVNLQAPGSGGVTQQLASAGGLHFKPPKINARCSVPQSSVCSDHISGSFSLVEQRQQTNQCRAWQWRTVGSLPSQPLACRASNPPCHVAHPPGHRCSSPTAQPAPLPGDAAALAGAPLLPPLPRRATLRWTCASWERASWASVPPWCCCARTSTSRWRLWTARCRAAAQPARVCSWD